MYLLFHNKMDCKKERYKITYISYGKHVYKQAKWKCQVCGQPLDERKGKKLKYDIINKILNQDHKLFFEIVMSLSKPQMNNLVALNCRQSPPCF